MSNDNPFLKFNRFLGKNKKDDNQNKRKELSCGCIYETEEDAETGEIKLTKNIKMCPKHQAEKMSKSISSKQTVIRHYRPEKI
ncbi:MAG: hypothetical protein NZ822_02465 [Patescibacteria group bacterium]|nr:hypothetical protein [Patescibacteria group bacterium]